MTLDPMLFQLYQKDPESFMQTMWQFITPDQRERMTALFRRQVSISNSEGGLGDAPATKPPPTQGGPGGGPPKSGPGSGGPGGLGGPGGGRSGGGQPRPGPVASGVRAAPTGDTVYLDPRTPRGALTPEQYAAASPASRLSQPEDIANAYQTILGRPASPEELAGYRGMTKDEIQATLINSKEHQNFETTGKNAFGEMVRGGAPTTPMAPSTPAPAPQMAAPAPQPAQSAYDTAGLAQLHATGSAPGYIPTIGTQNGDFTYNKPGTWTRTSIIGTPADPNYEPPEKLNPWEDPKNFIGKGTPDDPRRIDTTIRGFNSAGQWVGYARGGVIDEPMVARGMRTGKTVLMGEEGPEQVTPLYPHMRQIKLRSGHMISVGGE